MISVLLPNFKPGGAERVVVNLANELVRRGHSVDMVVVSATGDLLEDLSPQVRVVDLKAPRLRAVLFPLARYLKQNRPAAMLACMWPLTVLAVIARGLARSKTRLVLAEHTTWSRSEIVTSPTARWQVRQTMRCCFPFAEHIVTVSHGAADDLARFARIRRETISVVYNPVVGAARAPVREALAPEAWWSGAHKRVLAVGTLKLIKDYGTLLDAFARLRETVNARLLILGEGDCRGQLEQKVRQLGLEDDVFLHGFVRNTSPYYQHADLHVLSSTGEGLPTVIIEALEAGTPVVSTDCPSGPREILADGQFGQLVPVGDVAALATAMRHALNSRHDPQALKLRAQSFSIESAATAYEALLSAAPATEQAS